MTSSRPVTIGIIVVLAMTVLALPPAHAQGPQTTRALTISMDSVNPETPLQAFDGDPPMVFDFNGDGIKEVIVHNDNKRVYIFDSQTGQLDAEILTKYPPGWGARPINGVEAAVLSFGGVPHLVVGNSAAYITVLRFEQEPSSRGHFVFTKLWETRTTACEENPSMDAKPVLADLTNDGNFEILVQTEEVGVYALRMDGSTLWKQCIGGGNGEPAVADIDFDGQLDVIWASDGGVITAMNGKWGTTKWTFWANHPSFNLHSASVPVGPTIGQVDGVGPLDVVFGARDSHDADNWDNDHAALFVVKGNGQLLWMRQDPGGAPLTYTRPIIADVDNNGKADILWADWNTIGHKPPHNEEDAWQRTGPAHFYRYDNEGNLKWRTTLDTYWQNKDLALADVDNDGVQEVLANGPGPGGDGIWYLNSITGAKETFISTHPWKVSRGPIVEDLWNTGTMQWVVPVSAAASPATGGAIMVFDTHAPYNAMWPHLPYPVIQEGSSPPPPPGGFDPGFTVPSNVNNWWVEVRVDSASVVSSVTASVNGGAPQTLNKQSWGHWAKSFYVPTGASVVFTATNTQGQTASSQPHSWLGPPPPPPPPPSEDYQATFTVSSTVNNWWVEVKVTGNHPASSVKASVNGGAPVALVKQSWGHWAKSFYVATGSEVVFTATNNAGQSVVSPVFQWLGAPPPPPPPPSDNFTATFTVPSGVNNWWVEVKATGNNPVTAVTATVDGGTPKALAKQSWGNWAKSFHVPTGSDVVFTASDAAGRTATSKVFEWLSDGSPFTATFKVTDPSNNWWVETYVTSNKPVSKVEVKVDAGAWQTLPKTSWGSYAKSFYVPDNAQVQFRATSVAGGVVTSSTTTWI